MAIILNDNLQINVGKPVDSKYLNGLVPYADVSEVNTAISASQRYIGLTVNIGNTEYWYKDGVTNGDLVEKFASFSGGTVVIDATNIGSGSGVFSGKASSISGDTLQFRSLVGSGLTNVSVSGDEIIIGNSGDGVVSGATYGGGILSLKRTEGLSDVDVSIGVSGVTDGVVSGGTLTGTTLILQRTIGLPDVNIDLSAFTGDGVVSGATLSGTTLVLSRTLGLPDVTADLSTLSGGTTGNTLYKTINITTATTVAISGSISNATYIASGTTGYTLSSTPTTGSEITFVDGLGTALSSNITIEGNGNIIYDDTYALINTNYGSLTLVFDGFKWNVTAYVS